MPNTLMPAGIGSAALWMLSAAVPAQSAVPAAAPTPIELPSMDLSRSLQQVAVRTGRNIIAPDSLVRGLKAPPLRGDYTAEQAVALLLNGTGLTYEIVGEDLVITRSAVAAAPPRASETAAPPANIVVTGTRIRGALVASPVISLTNDEIRDRGQATLAEAIRTIPQNFGGGQNPGIGNNVPASSGVNVGSATSVNLRGLGSDATLTLIDGHRISYSASRQAVDISAIPLTAVDRIEILPDGASALYGSDAVAGVVNVILKRDFSGIETGVRFGGASDGGDFEQRYDLAGGARWGTSGFIATYEFGRTTAIVGRERPYTAQASPALTLFPYVRNHSATFSGHQSLTGALSLELDAFLNDRFSTSALAYAPGGNIAASGARLAFDERSFAVAPTLRYQAGGDWSLFLTGSYGRDHTHYDVKSYFQAHVSDFPGNCYCNHAASAEFGADGTLLRSPAGPVKLALGAGYRTNTLVRFNGTNAPSNISRAQDSYYAYGELSLPLVSPDQQVAWAHRLSLSAAARYERYPGIGSIVTPKLAAIYAPDPDFTLETSWGKSFRAPTLYQHYQAVSVVLLPAAVFGGSGLPPGSTALLVQGGNPDLKPERATNWSATLDVHPRAIDGAKLQLSLFRTRYRDRVVTPINFLNRALSDPIYADRLTLDPSAALQAATIAQAPSLTNGTGAPYDPANVAVLINDRSINAGYQKVEGADALLTYRRTLGGGLGEIGANLDATYLRSWQQIDPLQPVLPLAGIIFNPPHWSARGDVAWTRGNFTLDSAVNYIGPVEDSRIAPAVRVHGMTTFDVTARLKSPGPRGVDASLTVQNLFNQRPARIATSLPSDAPYDSTNYSPVGRFIALSLLKRW